jgi:hypothetical protein
MDERQRLDEYLAWRQTQRKEQRARLYRRARVAGTVIVLMVLTTALAFAVAGWPRAARRDVARLPVAPERLTPPAPAPSLSTRETPRASSSIPTPPASAPAEPRVTSRRSLPPAARRTPADTASPSPSASMSSATAEPETPRNAPPEVVVQPPGSPAPRVVVVDPPPAPTVKVEPPPTVVVEQPARRAAPPTVIVDRPARRAAAPAPTPGGATPQNAPAAPEERMDTLKRLTGYIPEVWLARTVARWVKTQPPGETAPPPPERELPQAK